MFGHSLRSKRNPSWRLAGWVGQRDAGFATAFIADVKSRISSRIQLTTDGHKMYITAVADNYDWNEIDFAQLVKVYGNEPEAQKRYSPAICTGCEKHEVTGSPDPKHISTSYIERQNLTVRMQVRRFTRLTNAFSKKLSNHIHAVALFYMHYNFCRVHQTLRVTPAMEAGISQHVWSIEDFVKLAEHGAVKVAA